MTACNLLAFRMPMGENSSLLAAPAARSFWSQHNYIKFSISFGMSYGGFRTSIGYLSTFFASSTASTSNAINYGECPRPAAWQPPVAM